MLFISMVTCCWRLRTLALRANSPKHKEFNDLSIAESVLKQRAETSHVHRLIGCANRSKTERQLIEHSAVLLQYLQLMESLKIEKTSIRGAFPAIVALPKQPHQSTANRHAEDARIRPKDE